MRARGNATNGRPGGGDGCNGLWCGGGGGGGGGMSWFRYEADVSGNVGTITTLLTGGIGFGAPGVGGTGTYDVVQEPF